MARKNQVAKKGEDGVQLKYLQRMGAPVKYDNPEDLARDCQEYFEKTAQRTRNGVPVPYTIEGLVVHLGITRRTWIDWREKREDLTQVITECDEMIRNHQIEGALTGQYNTNLTARLNGISEKIQQERRTIDKLQVEFIRPGDNAKLIEGKASKEEDDG